MAEKKKKKVSAVVRIEQDAGAANMGKVGQALGPHGVNIVQVAKEYNEGTARHTGLRVAADIIIFEDRSFEVRFKTPATTALIKRELGLKKGAPQPSRSPIGKITREQLRAVAEVKMPDLNANSIDQAEKIVMGTARSMGLTLAD